MAVTVYSKPGCYQCKITATVLDNSNVEYEYLDVTTDPAAYARVQALGYMGLPVVETDDDHWQGLRPDKLAGLALQGVSVAIDTAVA